MKYLRKTLITDLINKAFLALLENNRFCDIRIIKLKESVSL